jgi:hypothetical protein
MRSICARRPHWTILAPLFCVLIMQSQLVLAQKELPRATILIDTNQPTGEINPLLYGQTIEMTITHSTSPGMIQCAIPVDDLIHS